MVGFYFLCFEILQCTVNQLHIPPLISLVEPHPNKTQSFTKTYNKCLAGLCHFFLYFINIQECIVLFVYSIVKVQCTQCIVQTYFLSFFHHVIFSLADYIFYNWIQLLDKFFLIGSCLISCAIINLFLEENLDCHIDIRFILFFKIQNGNC